MGWPSAVLAGSHEDRLLHFGQRTAPGREDHRPAGCAKARPKGKNARATVPPRALPRNFLRFICNSSFCWRVNLVARSGRRAAANRLEPFGKARSRDRKGKRSSARAHWRGAASFPSSRRDRRAPRPRPRRVRSRVRCGSPRGEAPACRIADPQPRRSARFGDEAELGSSIAPCHPATSRTVPATMLDSPRKPATKALIGFS